jgi:CheY-like chemotaxis protein
MMPGMDGWTLIEAIRVVADTRNLPIVAMSAKFGLINQREHGVQGYVAKPIDAKALVDTLEAVLRQATVSADR